MFKLIFITLFALALSKSTLTPLGLEDAADINAVIGDIYDNLAENSIFTHNLYKSAQAEIKHAIADDQPKSACGVGSEHIGSLEPLLHQLFCLLNSIVPNGKTHLADLSTAIEENALFPQLAFGRIGIVITPTIGFNAIVNKFKNISGYTF